MKNIFRIIAVILCVTALSMTLCSCQYLDDKRANTAVYTDDSRESFTFNHHLYKRITVPSGLSFIMSEVQSGRFVTAPDVPVLLNDSYGDTLYYDALEKDNPTVFRVYRNSNRYDSRLEAVLADDVEYIEDDERVREYFEYSYVREDLYDSVQQAIDEANLDHYVTMVYTYDDPSVPWEGGKYLPILLDDEITEVITRTLNGDKVASWRDLPDNEWYNIYLLHCDKDMLICENNGMLSILTDGSRYYLYSTDNVGKLYQVSDDDFSVIRRVYSMCRDSMEVVDLRYYRENADMLSMN